MNDAHEQFPDEITRRGFLLGALGTSLVVTAAGTTGLLLRAAPAHAAGTFAADVTGDYSFDDPATGCQVRVTVRNGVRRIQANGLPNHATGAFPNAHNPNRVSAQIYDYSLPTTPKTRTGATAFDLPQPFGIAVNGVIFDPLAAEWYRNDPSSGWSVNALGGALDLGLDDNAAHVQPSGAYHYHGIPTGLVASLPSHRHSPLVGWAGDGFPIYLDRGYRKARTASSGIKQLRSSYRLKSGTRPSGPGGSYNGDYNEDYRYVAGSGALDAANGRFQRTPEFPSGTYCYILTREFPVVPRAFRGAIASSFVKAGGGQGHPTPNQPPPRQ